MKMKAIKLESPYPEQATCEHCGKGQGTWGVVPSEEIIELQGAVDFTTREAALFLLEESEHGTIANGTILCTRCLEVRSGQPIPRKRGSVINYLNKRKEELK